MRKLRVLLLLLLAVLCTHLQRAEAFQFHIRLTGGAAALFNQPCYLHIWEWTVNDKKITEAINLPSVSYDNTTGFYTFNIVGNVSAVGNFILKNKQDWNAAGIWRTQTLTSEQGNFEDGGYYVATLSGNGKDEKLTGGWAVFSVLHAYKVAVTSTALDEYFTLSNLQANVGTAQAPDWQPVTDGTVYGGNAPIAYKYTVAAKAGVAASETNIGNIVAGGALTLDNAKDTYTATVATPLVYTAKVTSQVAPTNVSFKVGDKPYNSCYTQAPADGGNVYTYTLITDQHAAGSKATLSLTANGVNGTVADIASGVESIYTMPIKAKYEYHVCGDKGGENAKLFPDGWDDSAMGVLNNMTTTDGKTYTWSCQVPAGFRYQYGETTSFDFGLRAKNTDNAVTTWMTASEAGKNRIANGVSVKVGTGGANLKFEYTFIEATTVNFKYVRTATDPNSDDLSGTLTVSWAKEANLSTIKRGTNDNVGGLDFSKANIQVTDKQGKTYTVPPAANTVAVAFENIASAVFTDGIVIHDVDGREVPEALKNFKYATSKQWPASVIKNEDGTITFYAKKTDGAQYYSFCYHDWRTNNNENNMGAKKVEVKLANGKILTAWHTSTPGLAQGSTNPDAPVNTHPGEELLANGGVNFDKSYGMVATPPANAPGKDYWYMVMTDLDGAADFTNAVITVYPKAHEFSGAIPVHMTLTADRIPTRTDGGPDDHIIRHYMNSQFRIYRVGSEVDWDLSKATEYVSNTGVFYVDGLKKNTAPHDELGIGYKFSTIDPRNDRKNGVNDWTNFNKGVFGYTKWNSATRDDIDDRGQRDLYWGNDTKEGNVSPAVDGTLVIDLREFVNAENIVKENKYGYLHMHNGFFRQTKNYTMLFYGGVNTADNILELTRVGLWNNDGCQVVDFGKAPDYKKKYFYQIVGGFEVEVKDAAGNIVDANGEEPGTKFVHMHPTGMERPYNEDYEFLNSDGRPVMSLPAMQPGTYTLEIHLLPAAGYENTWNKTICDPLILTATIEGEVTAPQITKVEMRKVDVTPPTDASADHKGHNALRPVKYAAVNEAVASCVLPAHPGYSYKLQLDGAELNVTGETTQDGLLYEFVVPVDGATRKVKPVMLKVTPVYTVEGVATNKPAQTVTLPETDLTDKFPSQFVSVNLNQSKTQVVVTEGALNKVKHYVYSANPVFDVARTANTSTQLYAVGGFDFDTSTLYNVTLSGVNGAETYTVDQHFDDYQFSTGDGATKQHDFAPRMAYNVAGQLQGLAGYAPYKSGDWNNDTNNWAQLMTNVEWFGMMVPHYYASTTKYTGNEVPKHGGFTANFYTYYPVRDAKGNISLVEVPGANVTVGSEQTGSGVTGVEDVAVDADPNALMDVYTVSGVLIMRNVTRQAAVEQLQPGLYIIGREKVAVQ